MTGRSGDSRRWQGREGPPREGAEEHRAVVQAMLGQKDSPGHSASWRPFRVTCTGLPSRPGTNVHLRPQATGCHHLSLCPPGEVGMSSGYHSEVWGPSPALSALLAQRGRVRLSFHAKPQVRPPRPASPGARDCSCLLCSCHSSKAARGPSPRSKPSLNLPSRELPAGQLRQLRRWIRAGFT